MTVAARPVSWLDSAIPSPSSMKMPQPTPPIISVHSLGNVEVGSPPSQGKLLLSGVPIMVSLLPPLVPPEPELWRPAWRLLFQARYLLFPVRLVATEITAFA